MKHLPCHSGMISLRILNTSSMLPSFAITTSYLVKKFSTSFMRFSGLFRNPMLMRLSYFMFWTMLTSERISPSSRIFLLWCIFSSSRIVYFPTEFTFTSRSIIVPFWSNTNSLPIIYKFSYFSIGIIWFRTVAIMSKKWGKLMKEYLKVRLILCRDWSLWPYST